MSCPNSNAPIDITMANIYGKCDLKCNYNFKYSSSSSCVATNRGDYISLAYENPSTPPVIYSDITYFVDEIRIYSPSLHSYNGNKADGEMIIVHNSTSGSKPLLVCVPIVINSKNSSTSVMLDQIVTTMSAQAPKSGDTINVSLTDFNLNAFVPRKTFFKYTAIEPYQPCTTEVIYIVYIPSSGPIDINEETLKLLNTFILPNTYVIKTGPKLFFNKKGPSISNTSGMGDEIYIDCQPVGVSEEEITVVTGAPLALSDLQKMLNPILTNPYFITVVGSITFTLILYIMGKTKKQTDK